MRHVHVFSSFQEQAAVTGPFVNCADGLSDVIIHDFDAVRDVLAFLHMWFLSLRPLCGLLMQLSSLLSQQLSSCSAAAAATVTLV